MSSYTLVAGAKPKSITKAVAYDSTRAILDGITIDEKQVAAYRRREEELNVQLSGQAAWLNDPANRRDPAWEQRQMIHEDRQQERQEVQQRCERMITMLDAQIETLEGSEREEAVRRLCSWSEAPF